MRLLTLGSVDLLGDVGESVRGTITQPKRLALLCYLALREPSGFHRRAALLPMFWPESDESRARNTLRNTLHHLRSALGSEALESRGEDELALNPAIVGCDAVEFEALIAARRWEEALALHRGPLLPGFGVEGIPDFNDWLDRRRRSIADQAARAARELVAAHGSDVAKALTWAQRWTDVAPYDEAAMRELLMLLDESGQRGAAVAQYATWRERFERDCGAPPSLETMRIVELIQARGGRAGGSAPLAASARGEPPRSLPGRRRGYARLAAAVIAVLLVGGVFARYRGRDVDSSDYARSVVVLPFSYGGDTGLGYLRQGMVDLLAHRIGSLPGIHATDPRAVLARVGASADDAEAIGPARGAQLARTFGARYFVLGSIVELRRELHVSAALYDVERPARAVSEFIFSDSVGGLLELADNIGYLLVRTHLPDVSGMPGSAEQVRTGSLSALRAYLEGEQAYSAAHYDAAFAAYQRAITLDSLFARAYLRMGMAAQWLGRDGDLRHGAAQAYRLAGRLTPDEQLLVRGWNAHIDGAVQLADSLYSDYLHTHPENADAWLQLGEVRFHWGTSFGNAPPVAEGPFRRALALMPDEAPALTHLIRIAGREGNVVVLDSLVAALLALGPRPLDAFEARAIQAIAHADTAALMHLARAAPLDMRASHGVIAAAAWDPTLLRSLPLTPNEDEPTLAIRDGMMDVLAGRYADAMAVFERIPEDRRGWSVDLQAIALALPFVPRDSARARALLAALPRYAPLGDDDHLWNRTGIYTPRRLLLQALLSIQVGEIGQALELAGRMDREFSGRDAEYARQGARVIRATIAFERSDWESVLRELGAPGLFPVGVYPTLLNIGTALDRFLRARALEELGRFEAAERWFATFPDNTAYDLHYVAAASQRRAAVLDSLGRAAAAQRHRDRAATLWRTANDRLD